MAGLRQTIAVAALACATGAIFGARSDAGTFDSCGLTTKAAFQSCSLRAQADSKLASGKCNNLPDAAARKTCARQATIDGKAALQNCKDQNGLRQAVCARLGPAPYSPVIAPANFVSTIDNPFFPLTPGTTFIYEGQTHDGFEHVEFAVTHATRVILGVTCVEVHDTRKLDGVLTEDTRDWFTQDTNGNVWYFGENTTLVAGGLPVDLSGSWTAGVDGAEPGFVMEGHPAIADFYRQEFLLGGAEDLAEVKSLSESVTVPYGSFNNCLKTEESSPLKPGDIEHKFYASGVGNLLTIDLATNERSELVQITTGN